MMANRRCFTVILISFLIIFSGCSEITTEKEQPLSVRQTFTPPPALPSATATTFLTATPEVTPLPISAGGIAGKTIRSLCLTVHQIYPDLGGGYQLNLMDGLTSIFAVNGIQVMQETENCDASMVIDLKVLAFSADYSGAVCFTGASASGTIQLQLKEGSLIQVDYDETISPPFAVTSCPKDAEGAPLEPVISLGLFDGFGKLWSYGFLVNPIQRADVPVLYRNMAAELCIDKTLTKQEQMLPCLMAIVESQMGRRGSALNMLKSLKSKALPAVPGLVRLLEPLPQLQLTPDASWVDPRKEAQESALEALVAITGQNFGMDSAKWLAWWNSAGTVQEAVPIACGQYANLVGSTVQVSGVIEFVSNESFGISLDFRDETCFYTTFILDMNIRNFDPTVLESLKVGNTVSLTGVISNWVKGQTVINVLSIESVTPPG